MISYHKTLPSSPAFSTIEEIRNYIDHWARRRLEPEDLVVWGTGYKQPVYSGKGFEYQPEHPEVNLDADGLRKQWTSTMFK